MKALTTSIEINATAEQVWNVLTDFSAYSTWNSFIKSIEGKLMHGATLKIEIAPPSEKSMRFSPKIMVLEPQRELCWLGHVLIPGIFDGEHRFAITRINDHKVLFTQSENFSGLLVPLFAKMLNKAKLGFEEMNQALKLRVENQL